MDRSGLDALLLTAPENLFYLTGYQTKAVFTVQLLILHRTRAPHLVKRQMEMVNADLACAHGFLDGYTLHQDDDDPLAIAANVICDIVGERGATEMELGSWTMPAQRAQALQQAFPGIAWQDATGLVDRLRLVKSPRGACGPAARRSDRRHRAGAERERPCTRLNVEDCHLRVGISGKLAECDGGPPHRPDPCRLGGRGGRAGRPFAFELTGVKHRYHAPFLRVAFVGAPVPRLRHDAEILQKAHAAAVAAMVPGRPMKVINAAAQAAVDPAPGRGTMSTTVLRTLARRQMAGLWLVLGFVSVCFLYPLFGVLLLSVTDSAGHLSFATFTDVLTSAKTRRVLLQTIKTSVTVSLVCLVVGYPAACCLARLQGWKAPLCSVLILFPFLSSSLVRTFVFIVLLGRRGALNQLLDALGVPGTPLRLLLNQTGVVIGMSYVLLPCMLLSRSAA